MMGQVAARDPSNKLVGAPSLLEAEQASTLRLHSAPLAAGDANWLDHRQGLVRLLIKQTKYVPIVLTSVG